MSTAEKLKETADQLDLTCEGLKRMFDATFGICVLCRQSSVASVHDSENAGSHWFVRQEEIVRDGT